MRFLRRAARGTTAAAGSCVGALALLAASGASGADTAPATPAAPATAAAATTPAPAAAAPAAPTESVTEALIRLLAEHNAISKGDAEALIQRLQAEQAVQQAPVVAAPAAPAAPAAATAGTPPSDGAVRVFYVPESEKKRIREELRGEVLAQAKAENWAAPSAMPEWLNRFSFFGDTRVRHEDASYDDSNNVPFLNFQALNAGAPFNINPSAAQLSLPFLNTSEDRRQERLRARFGFAAQVSDGLTANVRIATGNTSNPVSTNQTLGPSFNKLSLVLDRAYLDWRPLEGTTFWAGRMPNPFVSTEMLFDDDLNLDGIGARYQFPLGTRVTPFATVAAFTLESTGVDFPNNNPVKVESQDKALFAAQVGAAWKARADLDLRGTLAYYDYLHVMGRTSKPCFAATSAVACNTDHTRPGFLQKGNTLFGIRDFQDLDDQAFRFQYFGLASDFNVLDATLEIDLALDGPLHAVFTADYAHNFAYDAGDAEAKDPVNNFKKCRDTDAECLADPPYESGNDAWYVQVLLGRPKVVERWDWSVAGGYRRIEGDALLDAFTDSDFHLGGTNARGYHFTGSMAFARNAWLTLRWLSAEEVTGPPLSIDTLYLDLNARF